MLMIERSNYLRINIHFVSFAPPMRLHFSRFIHFITVMPISRTSSTYAENHYEVQVGIIKSSSATNRRRDAIAVRLHRTHL
jgi:hypothetical protein